MPLGLKYPSVTRKNTTSQKSDISVSDRNRSTDASLTTSVNNVAPATPKQTALKAPTNTPPHTLARKPSQASVVSTASNVDKKRATWRGVAKSLPHILKSPRGASSTSLASVSQEPVPPLPGSVDTKSATVPRSKIPARRTTLPPKASTLDKPSTTPAKSVPREGSERVLEGRKDITRTSTESDGSETLVDLQSAARSLGEELSATQHKLYEVTNESSALREHIRALESDHEEQLRALESAHEEQLRRSVEEAVSHAKDELLASHASGLGVKEDRILDLQRKNDELASRLREAEQLKEKSDRDNVSETDSLRNELRDLQAYLESVQHDLKTNDDAAVGLNLKNEELRARIADLEAESGTLIAGAAKTEGDLLKDLSHLRQQLEIAQNTLSERDTQISELQAAKVRTEDMLVRAQAAMDEKEMVIGDLKRRGNDVDERNESLETMVSILEREEARLKVTVDDYERRAIEAADDIQTLRNQLTSSTSSAQQLQSSLDARSIESNESLHVAQDAADKLNVLRKRYTALEEQMQVLESQNKAYQTEKADMIRIHSSEIEAERRAIRNLRRSIESIERDSGAKDERSSVLVLTNEELQREIKSLKELREREGQESRRLRKQVEESNLVVSTLEEKNKIASEALTAEIDKLSDEVDNLQRQLVEAQLHIQELNLQAQSQGDNELKRKEELQKTNATIDEQKTVIERLQQSIGEISKDDHRPPKPQLVLNLKKPDSPRTHVQPSHSSSPPSNSVPSRPSPPAKRYSTSGTETRAASVAPSTSSTPLKALKTGASPNSSSHEASRMLAEHEHAFQVDSDSEGDHQSGSRRQLKDIKRGRQRVETSFVYKMGHSVFGSLWRRVWG